MKYFFIFFIFFSFNGFSQQNKADSLKIALSAATNDSVRSDIMANLATYYAEDKRNSALYYAEKLFALAKSYNHDLDVARALSFKGYILWKTGKLQESFQCLRDFS